MHDAGRVRVLHVSWSAFLYCVESNISLSLSTSNFSLSFSITRTASCLRNFDYPANPPAGKMRVPLGLAIAIAPLGVLSQVITITERPSACSAIYTSGSSSVTVVHSTVTVAPIPFTDALVNGGTPFVIEVQPGTAVRRRQSERSMYINADGRTTTNGSEAVVYRILNGTLQSIAGGYVSTDASADSALFAISAVAKAISSSFFSRNLHIGWNNTAFDGGACDFYTTPADDGSLDIIAYFRGVVDASWLACTFAIQPTGGLVLEPTTSTSVSTIISMGNGLTTTPAATASTSAPSPTVVFTENGYCGPFAGTCDGIIFGSCCSQYGACGDTDEYCGAGCLAEFGVCDSIIASSSVAAGVSSGGPSAPAYSATAPQPATSPVLVSSSTNLPYTSVYLSTSGSAILTMTTMVPRSTSLPIYSVPGTPIGPINPPVLSSSTAAMSSVAVSSPTLPPSYPVTPPAASTFVGISSIPVVSISSSIAVSISVPGASSISSSSVLTTAITTTAGPGSVPPVYSSPDTAPSSSPPAPLPSFYSSPAESVSSVPSSVAVPPVYSSEIASSTALPTEVPPVYSETPSIPPVVSSTPVPVYSSTPLPDTYPSTTIPDDSPSSTSALILSFPQRCDFGEPPSYGQDDSYCEITLPQPMVLYGRSSVNTFASTNGVLSILFGTGQYENAATLPTSQVTEGDNETPLTALFPFWDDLAIPEGTSDYGIYYQLSDTGVTYEFYLTRTGQMVLFHFTVEYTYSNPGVAVFTYYEMDDPGDVATVGAQGCKCFFLSPRPFVSFCWIDTKRLFDSRRDGYRRRRAVLLSEWNDYHRVDCCLRYDGEYLREGSGVGLIVAVACIVL